MKQLGAMVAMLVTTVVSDAQEVVSRAWQQRLHVEIPLSIPVVEIDSANPFSAPVDQGPQLISSTAPRKLDVTGRAVVAAYVDAKGDGLGGVPLELPFPGMTTAVVDGFTDARFDAARSGDRSVASWTVVEVVVTGKIKESEILDEKLELPNRTTPPQPSVPPAVAPSGNLINLPVADPGSLTTSATPRRLKFKVAGRDADVPVRALIHVTAEGRCDRFVPLELDSGFETWLSAYLATSRLQPATLDGQPVDGWAVYSARVRMKLSGLQSTTFRASTERTYEPRSAAD